jgi:putative urate catabolism protein
MEYPRDMIGYGENPPNPEWPGGARLALQIVLNYEEGAESSILHGDEFSEHMNSDMTGVSPWAHERNLVMESHYEYGSRVGVWSLLDLFAERAMPVTVFAVGMALERTPDVARRFVADGHEIAAHGWRWIDYRKCPAAVEADHINRTVAVIEALTGSRPLGWYTGRVSPNTRRLVCREGGFLYDSDAYNDDLPYWTQVDGQNHLIVPYAFDTNDMRFASAPGFNSGDDYFGYLRDSFDFLYATGAKRPRMMSVGLHCRLAGRPGRLLALQRFLDHVARHRDVWICRRIDIARHWIASHPAEVAPGR